MVNSQRSRLPAQLEELNQRLFIEQAIYHTKMDMRTAKRKKLAELRLKLDALYDKFIQATEREYVVIHKGAKK